MGAYYWTLFVFSSLLTVCCQAADSNPNITLTNSFPNIWIWQLQKGQQFQDQEARHALCTPHALRISYNPLPTLLGVLQMLFLSSSYTPLQGGGGGVNSMGLLETHCAAFLRQLIHFSTHRIFTSCNENFRIFNQRVITLGALYYSAPW